MPTRTSELCVCFGCIWVRNTALDRKWSPPISGSSNASAFFTSVLLMIVRYSRSGSSGFSAEGVRSNLLPVAAGAHMFSLMPKAVLPAEPCTISMQASRTLPAAVCARAVRAGTMASRNGRATVTPRPLRAARRDRCFCVMNIVSLSAS